MAADIFMNGIPDRVPLPPSECAAQKAMLQQHKSPASSGPYGALLVERRLASRMGEYLYKYPMRNLFDGDPGTPWVEWLPGGGVGAAIIVGSNDRELTFRKIRVVNGCARDKKMFGDNNRVKELAVFAPGAPAQYVVLADTAEPQTLDIASFTAAGIAIGIKSVYPGDRFDDTCLSELKFITNEPGEWPAPARDLVEIHPVYPAGKETDFTDYTYPHYDFYRDGRKVGTIESDFLSFSVSTAGVVVINDRYGNPPVSVARFGDISGELRPKAKDWNLPELAGAGSVEVIGWFPGERVCMLAEGDKGPDEFLMYSLHGERLRLEKKIPAQGEELKELRSGKSAEIRFLDGKGNVYLRRFCPQ